MMRREMKMGSGRGKGLMPARTHARAVARDMARREMYNGSPAMIVAVMTIAE